MDGPNSITRTLFPGPVDTSTLLPRHPSWITLTPWRRRHWHSTYILLAGRASRAHRHTPRTPHSAPNPIQGGSAAILGRGPNGNARLRTARHRLPETLRRSGEERHEHVRLVADATSNCCRAAALARRVGVSVLLLLPASEQTTPPPMAPPLRLGRALLTNRRSGRGLPARPGEAARRSASASARIPFPAPSSLSPRIKRGRACAPCRRHRRPTGSRPGATRGTMAVRPRDQWKRGVGAASAARQSWHADYARTLLARNTDERNTDCATLPRLRHHRII